MKPLPSLRSILVSALTVLALFTSAFLPLADESYWARQLRLHGKMDLPVDVIDQSRATSCGEAVIVMAYNYAYPETQLTEQEVIDYAVEEGYYTERKFPYTSPENMVRIAEHYADTVATGVVNEEDEALQLLIDKLTGGDPVIIDVFTLLYDPDSGAHFVVVTGIAINPDDPNDVQIHYNDPLTGMKRVSDWYGGEGIWNAWQNNSDPGGPGWWMVIASS
jgi:hypothetical protein